MLTIVQYQYFSKTTKWNWKKKQFRIRHSFSLWANFRRIELYSSVISRKLKKYRKHSWDKDNEQKHTESSMNHYTESFDALKWLSKTKPATHVSDFRYSRMIINCPFIKGLYSTSQKPVLVSIDKEKLWLTHSFALLICPLMYYSVFHLQNFIINISLCCLFFFDIRILIAPLVFSNSSYITRDNSVVALLHLCLTVMHDSLTCSFVHLHPYLLLLKAVPLH